jgi:ABC-2 type transport system ATP-binding protein
MVLGLVRSDSGHVNVLGINMEDEPVVVKKKVGYVPESPCVYEFLTGLAFLHFPGDLYEMKPAEKKIALDDEGKPYEFPRTTDAS